MKTRGNRKNVQPAVKKVGKKSGLPNVIYPEATIVQLAKQGRLAIAGQKALQASLRKGLSVTVLDNDGIYRIHPDGSRTLIKKIAGARKYHTDKFRLG